MLNHLDLKLLNETLERIDEVLKFRETPFHDLAEKELKKCLPMVYELANTNKFPIEQANFNSHGELQTSLKKTRKDILKLMEWSRP